MGQICKIFEAHTANGLRQIIRKGAAENAIRKNLEKPNASKTLLINYTVNVLPETRRQGPKERRIKGGEEGRNEGRNEEKRSRRKEERRKGEKEERREFERKRKHGRERRKRKKGRKEEKTNEGQ